MDAALLGYNMYKCHQEFKGGDGIVMKDIETTIKGIGRLGKEWYEHSEGFCSYLKGKTAAEIAKLPAEDSDADLAALCTIDVTELQKAAAKALEEAK